MGKILSLAAVICLAAGVTSARAAEPKKLDGKVNTYYVAADEVEWDYAPSGLDQMTGKPFDALSKIWVENGPDRIGKVYRKAIYHEYTDGSFTKIKPPAPAWEHRGMLGPILRGEVGETIRVVFKNNATRPYSMHPHGVFYEKSSEGASYNDGTSGPMKGGVVPPGKTHTYEWQIPERAGPGPNDPSSVVWLYHSHADEPKDVNSGLIGAMIVNARGASKPDGTPKDVDREFVTLFIILDENQAWYLDYNIKTYAGDPKKVDKGQFIPVDLEGNSDLFTGGGFATVNHKAVINGFTFGNMPMMTMKKGERVRWYLISLGDGANFHSPHWHGNTVLWNKSRTDVITLMPAQMAVADMVPDNPGIWMFHCHVSDHLKAGMHAHYHVLP